MSTDGSEKVNLKTDLKERSEKGDRKNV